MASGDSHCSTNNLLTLSDMDTANGNLWCKYQFGTRLAKVKNATSFCETENNNIIQNLGSSSFLSEDDSMLQLPSEDFYSIAPQRVSDEVHLLDATNPKTTNLRQSSITEYFKIKKLSQNDSQNGHDNTHALLTDSKNKIRKRILKIAQQTKLLATGPILSLNNETKMIKNLEILKKIPEILVNLAADLMRNDGNFACTPLKPPPNPRRSFWLKIFLIGKIYSLVCQNAHISQRQIYYQLKDCVSSQAQISYALFSISVLLQVEPWHLPITSSGAGLVYGDLKITTSNGKEIDCHNFGGTLIPQDVLEIKKLKSDAAFILVVEKDAVFQKLLDEDIGKVLATSYVLITGKGFPDYNTRLFSKLLWSHLRIPIFILTDGDPYGIEIMLTYRFGSMTRPHFLSNITIPEIQWLGILPSDIENLEIPYQDLTQADIRKIQKMQKRSYVQKYDWLERELGCMLKCKKKAGIEAVIDNNNSLTKFYLTSKLFSGDFF